MTGKITKLRKQTGEFRRLKTAEAVDDGEEATNANRLSAEATLKLESRIDACSFD